MTFTKLTNPILPGKKGKIEIKYNLLLGTIGKIITVESNAINYENGKIPLKDKGEVVRKLLVFYDYYLFKIIFFILKIKIKHIQLLFFVSCTYFLSCRFPHMSILFIYLDFKTGYFLK